MQWISFTTSALLLSVILLSGCAPVYQIKNAGPTAKLENNNSVFLFQNAKLCTDLKRTHSTPLLGGAGGYTVIPADKLVTVQVSENNEYATCTLTVFSFTPQPNNIYKITYAPKGSGDYCSLRVRNVTSHQNVHYITRSYNNNFWSGKGRCDDQLSK
ncbi:MAG: hypothetical protein A3I77_06395 [Gammaproteobacteria bacterium RIFCSPLOWO2_02_FULL_42_14]|nr:MAG: hypothetical protein A3B71_06990 [Gammaproteobacteria bacterium RIFCSPHIGHO2_02_FULL_42_43]OGT29323.1 MAG: hypothetical protein A2624_00565 [Gammaproteobacteria bacterium RIFCSPHIGHO2_01_FULL_42_8]OGT52624.1 MAG: hypothetical protein A3E54_06590 [Gammaproteobacteria bacterium RIFCSPHIGHO2_12_FULL_41_25]OGT63222.1 MAG: hypothetical protein A3I77_06395 [Gammaproteobacteria bacterium RIFCSPLOWO2_02_FULL_42_14]OGT86723.1 MAG: hypothetical protein A3G86_05220 [Gammaproteobacteria bacterium R